ncbi:MAG: hypothetical protein AAGG01_03025 [Planctomycetota bacterium]
MLTGSGASTGVLEQPIDAFTTIGYSGTDGISVLLLDGGTERAGQYASVFRGPAQGVRTITTDSADAACMEISARGDWEVAFYPSGWFVAAAAEEGRAPTDSGMGVLSRDGYTFGNAGEVATGSGDLLVQSPAATVWTIELPGCDEAISTDAYDADGNRSFSAGQFLLDDEHRGVVDQLVPAGGVAEIVTTCDWLVTLP